MEHGVEVFASWVLAGNNTYTCGADELVRHVQAQQPGIMANPDPVSWTCPALRYDSALEIGQGHQGMLHIIVHVLITHTTVHTISHISTSTHEADCTLLLRSADTCPPLFNVQVSKIQSCPLTPFQ